MKDLQEIINKKAKDRATGEVLKLINCLHDNKNLQELLREVYVKVGEETDDMRSAFWSVTSVIPNELINKLTEMYIPEESKKFVDKVEELSNTVNNLLDN